MKELIMYSTLGCHLCELAKTQIEPLLAPFALKLKEVDIADDDILLEKCLMEQDYKTANRIIIKR